jgi:hypothetical protein
MDEMSTTTMATPTREGYVVERDFIRVVFQQGLPQDAGVNGCRVEDVISVAIQRLEFYQSGPLGCQENADALVALRNAMSALEARRFRRIEQGVFNTMGQHVIARTEDEHEDFSATGA